MAKYLRTCNANHGGLFATSRESDAVLRGARAALADLINAPSPDEIVFGANMTTLTLHLSRAVARALRPGDEVIVTRLDHDANVTPWVLAAGEAGATVRTCDIRTEDCTLDLDDLRRHLNARTRLVAVGCASNAVGSINDVRTIATWAHAAGAWLFLDAVHYAPHAPIDVQSFGCDALACSVYKFFGPHVGVLWARRALLEQWTPAKLRPVPETLPDRWMTGTQNHEGIAGAAAAVDYLADIGSQCPDDPSAGAALSGRRRQLRRAMTAIKAYEIELSRRLLMGLADRPRFKVWGITDPRKLAWRVPTVSITMPGHSVDDLALHLARNHFYVWNGNMYALALTERLELEPAGGFLRLGLVHYNTVAEVDRVLDVLDSF
jgi:cysteine desulfurase family protein (TIGR01976 family)